MRQIVKFERKSAISKSFLIIGMLLASQLTWAAATFGAEFNFSNEKLKNGQVDPRILNSEAAEAARDAMKAVVLQKCQKCKAEVFVNRNGVKNYRIVYPDGWYFVIATDPFVVEVQTRPSTVQELEHQAKRIQTDIFDSAAEANLLPATQVFSKNWAASHIHVGARSALGQDSNSVKRLRNFLVDFANHSELANGIFTQDKRNAPALIALPQEQQEKFQKIIEAVDAGQIKTIYALAYRIRNEVYNVTVVENNYPTTKFQALNVNRIAIRDFSGEEQTFEIRSIQGQESAEDFLLQTRLIQARLDFLEKSGSLVEYNPLPIVSSDLAKTENFYRYVTETGLDFEPYEKFLTPFQKTTLPAIKKMKGPQRSRPSQANSATHSSCFKMLQ